MINALACIIHVVEGAKSLLCYKHVVKTVTAVRLKVEENQLVGVFGEIGVVVDALKGA